MLRVFRLQNGGTSETFVLTPDPGSNTITIVTQIEYVDDPRNIREGSDPVTLPATFGFNIHLSAFASSTVPPAVVDRNVRAFVTVDPPPGEN